MLAHPAMRLVVLLTVMCAAVGCSQSQLSAGVAPGGGGGGDNGYGSGGAGAAPECATSSDCAARGANCCDCPTFAVPATDPGLAACGEVTCPMQSCPDDVAAACQAGQCVLACKPVTCTTTCATGFAVDANGCLTCACAASGGSGSGGGGGATCMADTDCVRTRADCCGCAHGGSDTAVLATDQASFDASLMCSASPQCPSTDTCSPDLQPRCVAGTCQLAAALPPNACGRSDLPACPMGQTCTLNASDAATAQGVGVCQ